MESTFLNVAQMFVELSEKSDKLVRDNLKDPPQGTEWFKMIEEMAQKIVGEFTLEKSTSSEGSQMQFSQSNIPSYVSLIIGETGKSSPRVSSNLPARKRDHLHGKKSTNISGRKADLQNGNEKKMRLLNDDNESNSARFKTSHTQSGTPLIYGKKNSLRVKSEFDSANAMNSSTRRSSTRGKENSANLENGAVSSSSRNLMTPRKTSIRGKKISDKVDNESDCIIVENQSTSKMRPILDRTFVQTNSGNEFTSSPKIKVTPLRLRSGRLSSRSSRRLSKITSLEQEMFQKKLKGTSAQSREPHLVTRSSRFSMGKKKHSGLRETRQLSALGARSSSRATATVKKEMLQCKEELAAENLKKIQDARRMKIEEKKRQRDEKMERTKEKRMLLEKAKTLSTQKKTAENARSTRAQEKSNERATRSKETKIVSASEATAKISQANSKKKTPHQSESKKPTTLFKTASSKKAPALSNSKTPTSPSQSITSTSPSSLKGTPASSKGRRPTPPMKKESTVSPIVISLKKSKTNPTIVSLHNTTITVTGNNDSLKKTPTSPPVAKAISKLKEESVSASGQKVAESSSPSSSKKPKLEPNGSAPKAQSSVKKPDSYELTPDRSSFTSYDMSEIKSDNDDEDESTTQKPIPSWALGLRLRNALIHQYYNPIDTDELFGNVWNAPDLEQMFNVKKKAYCKRTSSAIWQSPKAFQ